MRCRRTLRQARQQKRCARSAILIYPISRAWSRRAVLVATDANSVCRSEALLRAERADARSVKQSVRFQPSMPRTSVGRCATPGASHPPAVRTQSTVTFLNGRNGDICIWWTHARGIVSKRADAAYAPGNRGLWLKIKCLHREEFVVIGWTNPEGSRPFLGALLLGYYDPNERLVYAGRVGSGINTAELGRLWRRLQPLATDKMPLDLPPPRSTRFGSPLILRPRSLGPARARRGGEVSHLDPGQSA